LFKGYYLTDRQGTVLSIVGASIDPVKSIDDFGGKSVARQNHGVFGPVRDRYEYTGRERDPITRLIYYRARWMEEATGQFTSPDPKGFAAGDVNLSGTWATRGRTSGIRAGNRACRMPGMSSCLSARMCSTIRLRQWENSNKGGMTATQSSAIVCRSVLLNP